MDIDGDGTADTPINGGSTSARSGIYDLFPLVIEYNPLLQLAPPPLFK